MPQDLTDDKSTLVLVMAWCRQATSHYLNQCWPSALTHICGTRGRWVNIESYLRDHFAYATSQWETLQYNVVSHGLGTYTKWSFQSYCKVKVSKALSAHFSINTECSAITTWSTFSKILAKDPIVHPWGRGVWCLLWVHSVVYVPPSSLYWRFQYCTRFECTLITLNRIHQQCSLSLVVQLGTINLSPGQGTKPFSDNGKSTKINIW